ncbi:nuclease-related domain-containing protein [Bradyrhizobium sp. UNPF46]|uniref:nuclease-related domain-containing protein n=1 Tax=Bradyrhizobium sp. UNPF46 TaxID=1141168 RepID=UPI00114D7771|nr:nuclease-related domain-containing protein [Bradyrhizobium sp. UNPF46]
MFLLLIDLSVAGLTMAFHFSCGPPHSNERDAIEQICQSFGDEWILLTNLPPFAAENEIDVVLLGPKGIIVLELKYFSGKIFCPKVGDWEGISKKGNPLNQAFNASQGLKDTLVEKDKGLKRSIWVNYAVVVTNPNCVLKVDADLPFFVDKLENVVALVNGRLATERRNKPISRELGEQILEHLIKKELPESVRRCWTANETKPKPVTSNGNKPQGPRRDSPPSVPPSTPRPVGRPRIPFWDWPALVLLLLVATLIFEVYSGLVQLFTTAVEQTNVVASNAPLTPHPAPSASPPPLPEAAPHEQPAQRHANSEAPPASSAIQSPPIEKPNTNTRIEPLATQPPALPLPPTIRSIVLNKADGHGRRLDKLPDLVQQRTQVVATVSYENSSSSADKIILVLKPAQADWEWPCAPEIVRTPKGVVSCWWNEPLESDRYAVLVKANGQVLSQKEFQVMVPPVGAPVDISPDRPAVRPPSSVQLQLAVSDFAIHPSATYVGENSVLSFSVRNAGTSPAAVALKDRSLSAGPCMARGWNPATAGIPAVDTNAGVDVIDRSLTTLAPGQSISGTISIASPDCNLTMLSGLQAVPVTLAFFVSVDGRRTTIPLTLQNVRFRPLGARYTGGSFFNGNDN